MGPLIEGVSHETRCHASPRATAAAGRPDRTVPTLPAGVGGRRGSGRPRSFFSPRKRGPIPPPDPQLLARLADTLRRLVQAERVVTTGPDYDASRSIWNGAVSARPGVIVRCADQAEAQAAVLAAR